MVFHDNNIILLDNGAGRIKFGRYSKNIASDDAIVSSMPNCTAKIAKQMQVLVGEDIDHIANGSLLQYLRPFDRGYLNNWGIELEIWSRIFSHNSIGLQSNPSLSDYSLVMTEPPFNPEPWQDETNEVVFEYFGFNAYARLPAAWFSAYNHYIHNPLGSSFPQSSLVVDSGFSFTHVMPFIDLKCVKPACKRVNVGGKLLTNYLKEVISYRQWNMMDEFKLMDQVKEELCYVSNDFTNEFKQIKLLRGQAKDFKEEKLKKYFVLPDFQQVMRGFVKPGHEAMRPNAEQLLTMESERFTIPEVLFHPSDVGLHMAGLPEACQQSIQRLNPVEQSLCTANTILTGGNCLFPQLDERFQQEFRPLISVDCVVQTYMPNDPVNYAWHGMYSYVDYVVKNSSAERVFVTKQQYLENGSHYCNQKFYNDW